MAQSQGQPEPNVGAGPASAKAVPSDRQSVSLLRMRGIEKRFGGVHALKGVDFSLNAGEVHVLLGENGAGKSTLMGVLSGAVAPDSGEMTLAGEPARFASPRDAHAAGVAMIPQELDLVPGLDIASNLFLGNELTRGGVMQHRRMRAEAQALLHKAGVSLDAGLRSRTCGWASGSSSPSPRPWRPRPAS